MKTSRTYSGRFLSASGLLLALAGFAASAQIPVAWEAFNRTSKWDLYGIGEYLHQGDVSYNSPYGNITTRMNDTGLGGFGMAFHFNEFIAVHADLMFGSGTIHSDVPTLGGGSSKTTEDAFIQSGRFNVDYNIINRRLTPFLTAGIGYQYLQTQYQNAPPVYWYDPYYGWQSGTPFTWETDFTWNVGGGVRWNVTDQFFIKATAGAQWLEYVGANGITTQFEAMFAIGWTF